MQNLVDEAKIESFFGIHKVVSLYEQFYEIKKRTPVVRTYLLQ